MSTNMKWMKALWNWELTGAGVAETGVVEAVDLRDALSRMMTSDHASGKLLGEAHGISVDILRDAPMNDETALEVTSGPFVITICKSQIRGPVVIYHDKDGVFLGECLGLGFWSKVETAGQPSAVTFKDIEDAEEFMKTWISGRPCGVKLVPVVADERGHASVEACIQAGLPGWSVES